jgi:hypothetical protein
MASALKFPDPFNFSASNLAVEWAQWRTQFEWYILATRKAEKDEDVLVGVLLSLLGREGVKIYETFVFNPVAEAKLIQPVLDSFTDYFAPLKSEVFDRFRFHKRHQQPGEPFDAWLVERRSMVKSCNYGSDAVVNSLLRYQIVLGVASDPIREKLLYETGLSLASACAIVRACESSAIQLSQILSRQESVHAVKDKPTHDRPTQRQSESGGQRQGGASSCRNCGHRHEKGACAARNITCFSCGKSGHFARWCTQPGAQQSQHSSHNARQVAPGTAQTEADTRQRPAQKGTYMQQRLHSMELEAATPQEQIRYLEQEYGTHELNSSDEGEEWYEDLSVNGSASIRFKLDSGATCNVLPLEVFRLIQTSVNLSPGPRVRNYGAKGGYLKVMGVFQGPVAHRGVSFPVKFVVVDEPGQPPILGLPTCKEMKLIKRIDAMYGLSCSIAARC